MGLNLNGLKNFNKELANRSGSKLYLQQKDITDSTDFRILPPLPNLDGNYFIEVVVWWINKKRYTSPETYGEACPIQAEVDKALRSKDKDLKALASDKEVINKKSEFWIPGLLLEPVYDPKDPEEVIDFKVVDGKAKVLTCGPALMKRINKMVTSKVAQNGTPNGITDRKKGFNLILSKTGKNLNTEYDAEVGDQWGDFDPSFFEEENIPDVAQMVSDGLRPDDYLEGVIRNYLYGEDMPEDPIKNKDNDDDKPAKKAGGKSPEKESLPKGTVRRPSSQKEKEVEEVEEEEQEQEEEPEEKKPGKPSREVEEKASVGGKKAPSRPGRNFMADLANVD